MALVKYNTKVGMKLEPVVEGTLIADGTEQTLVENDVLSLLTGYLSLDNMQAGDSVIIRQYVRINGVYTLYASETFSGVQTEPGLHFQTRPTKDNSKITLQQTAGGYRSFDYEFVREV